MLSKAVADSAAFYEGHELTTMEQAKNYYAWLLDEFRPALRGKFLEIGAGTGTLSEMLLKSSCEHLVCLEPAGNLVPIIERRLRGLTNGGASVEIIADTFEGYSHHAADEAVDSIVCINVLEHISDDLKALQEMRRLLSRGGSL